jgi:hypothetical protein
MLRLAKTYETLILLVKNFGQDFCSGLSVNTFGQHFWSRLSVRTFGQDFRSSTVKASDILILS